MMVAAVIASIAALSAQSASYGELFGVVRDSQGLVVAGASVTLRGPSVLGVQGTVTDHAGGYRFRALPPGVIQVTVEKSGFDPVELDDIVVRTGAVVEANARLRPAGVSEEVNVLASASGLDRRTTRLGTSWEGELVREVPSSTDLWGVLAQTPGVRMRGFDVGGSHKATQTMYETFGIRGQNRIVSEGVDSTAGVGGAGLYYDFYSVEEFQVSAGGADVEMTGPGALVVMAVKSGGDAFSGLFHLDYEGSGMVGENNDPELEARGFTGNPNLLFREAHADLGGPIARGKAWFFGAYNHFRLDKAVSGIDPLLGSADSLFNNYTGKLTLAVSSNDRLLGYSQWGQKTSLNLGLAAWTPVASTQDQEGWSWVHKIEWQRVGSERLFATVKLAHFGLRTELVPKLDPAVNPFRVDRASGLQSGSPGGSLLERFKPQLGAQLNYFLPAETGSGHDVKLGFEWLFDRRYQENRSGALRYQDNSLEGRPHGVSQLVLFNTPWSADIVNEHLDFYAQDRWSVSPRMTLTLGARFSRQHVFFHDVEFRPELTELFPPGNFPGETLQTWFDVAPRIGASFDVTGRGTTIAKAYYGRFYVNLADTLSRSHPVAVGWRQFRFVDPNENGLFDGLHELGELYYSADPNPDAVDDSLEHSFAEELSFSIEHELERDSVARLSFVRKTLRNDFGLWNRAQGIPLLEGGVPCGDAVFPCPPHPVTREPLPLVRLPEAFFNAQEVRVDNYPGGDSTYDTLQLAYRHRARRSFWLQASFDYQFRDELKATSFAASFSDPIDGGYFQNHHPSVPNRQTSTQWQLRALARVELPSKAAVSVNFRHQSGWPWAPLGGASIPGSGFQGFFLENVDENRSEHVNLLDVRAEKTFVVGERHRLSAMVDVYNLLNSNAELAFVLWAGPSFRYLLSALDPITMKVGLRWQF